MTKCPELTLIDGVKIKNKNNIYFIIITTAKQVRNINFVR